MLISQNCWRRDVDVYVTSVRLDVDILNSIPLYILYEGIISFFIYNHDKCKKKEKKNTTSLVVVLCTGMVRRQMYTDLAR